MNDTSYDPSTAPGPTSPPPRPSHHDLDRLRRSTTDRYVAGVAGGLGRQFNIDPTIVRVLLAVLTLFGGAGVLIYAVCWAFVPEDGRDRATFNISGDARKILLLAAAGVAFLLAMGDAFNGFNAGWPIATTAIVIGIILIARDRRNERRHPRTQQAQEQVAPPSPGYGGPTDPAAFTTGSDQGTDPGHAASWTAPLTDTAVPTSTYGAPPAWQPPPTQPALVPPHPKRTGVIWFWPTLAVIAIALGLVGIVDAHHHVDVGVYPAVAVAITGVMLVLGSFVGRSGGLVLIGLVSTAVLGMATVVGTFHMDGRNLDVSPRTAAQVQPEYSTHVGRIRLDLSDVNDPAGLAGRTISVHLNAGEVTVTVPKGLNVDIDAELGFAGGIKIPGYDGGGVQDKAVRHLIASPANPSAPLVLDLDVRVGQINVEQR